MTAITNSAIDGIMPEFDPTNPDAEYGDLVRTGGDIALNVATGGTVGNAFSQAAQGVEDLNELTDNTFTAENVEEVAQGATETLADLLGSFF